jgi:hypothetical protein
VNTDLRASLIASGAAALLSAFVGVLFGVAFLPLLLRAIIGGLVIGSLVYGGFSLAHRFMPELFEEGTEEAAQDSGLGSRVDIVLPAEGPEVEGEKVNLISPESTIEANAPDTQAEPEPFASSEAKRQPYEEDAGLGGESLLDGPDEASPVESVDAPPLFDSSLREGLDDLDVLPDLDSLSDSFAESPPSARTEDAAERRGTYGSTGNKASASGAAGSDPALLAQAVRTLLKRDQKG